jgi:signal peptidase I
MKIEEGFLPLRQSLSFLPQKSLVCASLDIGRVLAQRDGVTFTAQGTCMYPTIRPGDVLTIKPRPVTDIFVGDIAVCRAPDYLFSHRVIERGEQEGCAYIVTRPDGSLHGSDNPTFDENLLGVVVAIKRNGKPVPLLPTRYSKLIRYYYKKRLVLIEAKERLNLCLSKVLAHADNSVFYRFIIRTWFMFVRTDFKYVVQVPLNATLGDAVFHRFETDTFNPEETMNGRKITRWTIALLINEGRKPAAWAIFMRDEDDNWRVMESHVRLRYRGAGLKEALWQKAEKILATGSSSFDDGQSGINLSCLRRKN